MIGTLCYHSVQTEAMGEVKVEIELENTLDRGMALRGLLPEDQVRSFKVQVLAGTGAVMLVLPQDEVEALGLPEVRKAVVKYTNERTEERSVAGPVTVRVDGRAATVDCIVGPLNSEQKLTPRPESPFLTELKLK